MTRLLLLLPIFLVGCAVQTTGGYFYSRGSSPALANVHATIAEALVPTIDDNTCLDAEGERTRRLKLNGELVEENNVTVSEKSQHELLVENRCPGSPSAPQAARPPQESGPWSNASSNRDDGSANRTPRPARPRRSRAQ